MVKEIYIYATMGSWLQDTPDGVVKGTVNCKTQTYIEVQDENGYTQIIVLDKVFAVVY